MAEPAPVFRSPVRGVAPEASAAVAVSDLSQAGKILVDAGRSGAQAPVDFGFATRTGSGATFCVVPGQWFVVGTDQDPAGEPRDGASAVDVTHVRAMFRVSGRDAARALEKLCAIDFHDRFMPDGAAVRTSVAKLACEIARLDLEGEPSYLIVTGRSFGDYLYKALLDAVGEFGGGAVEWDGTAL